MARCLLRGPCGSRWAAPVSWMPSRAQAGRAARRRRQEIFVNFGSGTVTPIAARTNTPGPPIPVGEGTR